MAKELDVFVDCVLESHEGLCAFTTLPRPKGQSFCDMEIFYTPEFETEIDEVIAQIEQVSGKEMVRLA
jgi:hypothetical protein